jgi:hypothetical protein
MTCWKRLTARVPLRNTAGRSAIDIRSTSTQRAPKALLSQPDDHSIDSFGRLQG